MAVDIYTLLPYAGMTPTAQPVQSPMRQKSTPALFQFAKRVPYAPILPYTA